MSDEEIMEKLRRCFLFQINKGFRTGGGILSFCPHPYFCVRVVWILCLIDFVSDSSRGNCIQFCWFICFGCSCISLYCLSSPTLGGVLARSAVLKEDSGIEFFFFYFFLFRHYCEHRRSQEKIHQIWKNRAGVSVHLNFSSQWASVTRHVLFSDAVMYPPRTETGRNVGCIKQW